MKKVWIAGILATLMLTVPLTSVVGTSDTVEDCNCNPTISDSQVARIERLLDRLESRIDFILLRYGHIPEVEEKCEEVLDIINSDGFLEIFCDFLWALLDFFEFIYNLSYALWLVMCYLPEVIVVMVYFMYCDLWGTTLKNL